VARGQQYPLGVVRRFVAMVIDQGASFRCAAGALDLFWPPTGPEQASPTGATGRLWLLRIGLAALVRPKVIADDWVWMVDHSIPIGPCKCLVILGLRLGEFAIAGPLRHQDMELIDLVPMDSATKHTVAVCLEGAVAKTGAPRAILSDHAADLHGAIEIFRSRHPETVELYDIKHKAACLLKALLEGDEHWKRFAGLAAQVKVAIQQTDAACLVPPSQRSKSRFMNLGELVRWGRRTLALLDDPSRLERLPGSPDLVRDKLGWLAEFRESLAAWSAYPDLIEGALDFVRCRGLYIGAGPDLAAALPAASEGAARELRERLIAFVTSESSRARAGEILPGTTEVLESCFGRLKALEDGQSKSGFTGLVLSLGAMVSARTAEAIGEALERCRVRDVLDWCREKLGVSVQSLRKQVYAEPKCATDPGWTR
jgi:hypothetical protein